MLRDTPVIFTEQLQETDCFPISVTGTWKDPVPGWVENLNGPTGLLVGAGKGVIRSMHCRAEYNADIMPCDIAINSIIILAWKVANHR
jgi:fatty acyl-CoA reductase